MGMTLGDGMDSKYRLGNPIDASSAPTSQGHSYSAGRNFQGFRNRALVMSTNEKINTGNLNLNRGTVEQFAKNELSSQANQSGSFDQTPQSQAFMKMANGEATKNKKEVKVTAISSVASMREIENDSLIESGMT